MMAKGNGTPLVCANNLLRMVRGECPMDRVKGRDPRLVGSPLPSASASLAQDAQWLIETYEPRVVFQGIDFAPGNTSGDIIVTAKITEKEG